MTCVLSIHYTCEDGKRRQYFTDKSPGHKASEKKIFDLVVLAGKNKFHFQLAFCLAVFLFSK